jgi:hypothetical protein
MPEALLAMSNAIELAKTKPNDDLLALARAHEAMGRTLLEMGQSKHALAALHESLSEYKAKGITNTAEVYQLLSFIKQANDS